jgi:hypothetical protein
LCRIAPNPTGGNKQYIHRLDSLVRCGRGTSFSSAARALYALRGYPERAFLRFHPQRSAEHTRVTASPPSFPVIAPSARRMEGITKRVSSLCKRGNQASASRSLANAPSRRAAFFALWVRGLSARRKERHGRRRYAPVSPARPASSHVRLRAESEVTGSVAIVETRTCSCSSVTTASSCRGVAGAFGANFGRRRAFAPRRLTL